MHPPVRRTARPHFHSAPNTNPTLPPSQVSGSGTYMHPLGPTTAAAMDDLFAILTEGSETAPMTLRLRGRDLDVPMAGVKSKVARFTFAQLCGRPLGAEDYLGLAQAFHTILMDEVPQLGLNEINQVRPRSRSRGRAPRSRAEISPPRRHPLSLSSTPLRCAG